MREAELLERIFQVARDQGFRVETTAQNGQQIDFGHKKLHEGHLKKLLPDIFSDGIHIPTLIEKVAPGRPCAHKPMRKIVAQIREEIDSMAAIRTPTPTITPHDLSAQ
jgi:hypothetical protein